MLGTVRLLLHATIAVLAVAIGREVWRNFDSSVKMQPCVVVIGGGLAGVSAAVQTIQDAPPNVALRVIIIDKEPKLGGNSMKASSGINSYTPSTGDTVADFVQDTVTSGGGFSKDTLVETLVDQSMVAIEFLEKAGVDLSNTVQMGGHSRQRTHTVSKGGNVGLVIMKALLGHLATLNSSSSNITVEQLTGTKVIGLERQSSGWSVTVQSSQDGKSSTRVLRASSVVLATGGFGASPSMLNAHAPTAADVATTNGPFATGDGIGLGQQAGAALVDMDKVQIHPTGFVDPKNPQAGTKFLAPEKLRGVGGILLNAEGRRFVDEMHRRDHVTQAIQQLPGSVAWLLLDEDAVNQFGAAAIGFYASKGLATKAEDLSALASHLGVAQAVLESEIELYNKAAAGKATDSFGKTVFPRPVRATGPYYMSQITPVVHYCMGGLAFNTQAQVLDGSGKPIPGLFAAGEVTGGLHGANRLGGNSLLECAVFGRVAGRNALAHALDSVAPLTATM